MASAFGHAIAAIAIGSPFQKTIRSPKFWILGILCSILPDIDVIGFHYGIAYGHPMGHRGFTHSILFAILLSTVLSFVCFTASRRSAKTFFYIGLYLFLCTLSHSLLDAMTSGGMGVGFFIPFDNVRYFFPFRPILVSPISISSFLGEWGKRVLLSELLWIGLPSVIVTISFFLWNRIRKQG